MTSIRWRIVLVFLALVGLPVRAAGAQVRVVQVATVGELREMLAPGDHLAVIQINTTVVTGTLLRFGDIDLEVRSEIPQPTGARRVRRTVAIPHGAIGAIERFPDPVDNGAAIGTGIGAGVALAMFIHAYKVDANEFDEWGASYLLLGAAYAGIGGLIGWAADAANAKPRVRFEVVPVAPGLATAPSRPSPPEPGLPVRPAPAPRPEFEPERRRVLVGADVSWLGNTDWFYQGGVPLLENRTVGRSTVTTSIAAGVMVGRNMSVWGEVSRLSPSTVAQDGVSLCQPGGRFSETCRLLSDWPDRTSADERVAVYSSEVRTPYRFSAFVGFHTRSTRRIRLTVVAGPTFVPQKRDYSEQRYAVTGPGVIVPTSTYTIVGKPYVSHTKPMLRALTLALDAELVVLPPHLTIVPNVRFDMFALKRVSPRLGTSARWTF